MNTGIENLIPRDIEAFLVARKPGSYTLVDVRQPREYEEVHLPGAQLIPLPTLPEYLESKPLEQPVVVYCRTGARSMAAAKLFIGSGYEHVMNMVGGISSWQGNAATGPMDLGVGVFPVDAQPDEIVMRAYGMEQVLQDFYIGQTRLTAEKDIKALYKELAIFENRHKTVLNRLYSRLSNEEKVLSDLSVEALDAVRGAGEGGVVIDDFVREHDQAFSGVEGVIQLAMMIETQAYDFYLRCMRRAEDAQSKDIFLLLAREELAHLKLLGHRMDKQGE